MAHPRALYHLNDRIVQRNSVSPPMGDSDTGVRPRYGETAIHPAFPLIIPLPPPRRLDKRR
ncbi:MAG: hypothetical protein LBD65_01320 [Spirochaetaceae bacterium]|nr:hypothetical protein [Spirochaetaceae bacterium]